MQVISYFVYITAVLLCVYLLLINLYFYWFSKLKTFQPASGLKPVTGFSIIIPARNEEENIGACIRSILKNNYPQNLFEIIIADDFSTDSTPEIVQTLAKEFLNISVTKLSNSITKNINSYKKKAIEISIAKTRFDWIITTDADCILPGQWLSLYDAYIQKYKPVFVAAPVMFTCNNSFLPVFQCLDFISLQGITAASVSAGFHSMCNGANLAYSKKIFYEVGGFKNADHIASGDDMLLMHKVKAKYPSSIGYLFNQNAIATTAPMPDWKSFFNQRIRWASKATSYKDKKIFLVLLLVYLTNLFLCVLFVLCFFYPQLFYFLVMFILTKALFELPFMYSVSKFYSLQNIMIWFVLMQPFHILYTIISGWLGKFGTYKWKGRKVK
jgi:glycosyltransferase involved in cell wall biosynthesis